MNKSQWIPLMPGSLPPLQEKVALRDEYLDEYSIGTLQVRYFTGKNRLYLEDLTQLLDVELQITKNEYPAWTHWSPLPTLPDRDIGFFLGKGTKAEDWL